MASEQREYLVWSNEHRGWWKGNCHGYAPGLRGASRFTRAEAPEICRRAIAQAAHVGTTSELPVRVEDIDEFLSSRMAPAAIMDGDRPS